MENRTGYLFPKYLVKEVEDEFKTIFPVSMCGIKYQLENKYFKDSILEAYNVYVKYDGIYVKFESPNENYVCENEDNNSEYLLVSGYDPLKNSNVSIPELLRRLESYINNKNLIKSSKLNKYGELIKMSQGQEMIAEILAPLSREIEEIRKMEEKLEKLQRNVIVNEAVRICKKHCDENSYHIESLIKGIEKIKSENLNIKIFKSEVVLLNLRILRDIESVLRRRKWELKLSEERNEIENKLNKIKEDKKLLEKGINVALNDVYK